MSLYPKKWIHHFKSTAVFLMLLIFFIFYEDRNYISWRETSREAARIWRTPFIQRLTSRYPQVLNTPLPETGDQISWAKVDRIRRQLMKKGERVVWIRYPQDSTIYANSLKINIYQRIVEILYPIKIDSKARYELVIEANARGEFIFNLIEIQK